MRCSRADAGARTGNPIADALRAAARAPRPARARCCSSMIERARCDLAGEAMRRRRGARRLSVESEGALFRLAARILGVAGRGADLDAAAAARGQRLRSGAPAARPAAGAVARARCRCRSRAWSAGRDAVGAAGRRDAGPASPACLPACATRSAQALSRAGNMWRICRARPRGLPSFGLGRVLSAGAGTAGPRSCCATPPRSRRCTRVVRIAAAHWLGRI